MCKLVSLQKTCVQKCIRDAFRLDYPLSCQGLGALSEGQRGEVLNTLVHLRLRQRRQQLPKSVLC